MRGHRGHLLIRLGKGEDPRADPGQCSLLLATYLHRNTGFPKSCMYNRQQITPAKGHPPEARFKAPGLNYVPVNGYKNESVERVVSVPRWANAAVLEEKRCVYISGRYRQVDSSRCYRYVVVQPMGHLGGGVPATVIWLKPDLHTQHIKTGIPRDHWGSMS